MIGAYIRYPGAPRFEQFDAIVNVLVNSRPVSVSRFEDFGLEESDRAGYRSAREIYNRVYSALNDAAAEHFWHPYASVKGFLADMALRYDLYIASGVTQDILEQDFARHGFEGGWFRGIHGGNAAGGNDKGAILTAIKAMGYRDVLFVADSNRDLEYAVSAGVKFFRIRSDEDYQRLATLLPGAFPDERQRWDFEPFELQFYRDKAMTLITRYPAVKELPFVEMSRSINNK